MNKCPNCGAMTNEEVCMLCGTVIPKEKPVEVVKEDPVRISVIPLNENEKIVTETVKEEVKPNIETNEDNIPKQTIKVPGKNNIDILVNKELEKEETPKINTSVNDELLIDSYIKKHQKRLKKGFSICTFLFNAVYILYRKMILLGFFIVLCNILIYVFTHNVSYYLMGGLYLFLDIILAIIFKKLYMKHVKSKVEFIKMEFPDMREDELLQVCKIKGGTSLKTPFITIVLITASILANSILNYMGVFNELKDDLENKRVKIENVSFKLPSMLNEEYNVGSSLKYVTSSKGEKNYILDNKCDLIINIYNEEMTEKFYKNSSRIYLEGIASDIERTEKKKYDKYVKVSKIKEKNVENDTWLYIIIDLATNSSESATKYYYTTINKGKLYILNFNIYKNKNDYCFNAYNKVIDSLKFIK